MYLDYYSLERHPFRITPDTSLFFSGGTPGRGVVLDAMLYAIETGEGILKVVGEVGSGKTMLCRMLEESLPDSTEIVYIANPKLGAEDILYAIAIELKLPVSRDTSKLLVMQHMQDYLLKRHAANRKVVVIIEEAQGMPIDTLEEIRLFSNLETQRDKLMQIVLFGQPELDKNLNAKNIRQLRERITHSFNLQPLTKADTSEYIRFRLQAAGCPLPQVFCPKAEKLIAKVSKGLTRRINILADKAMLAAYADSSISSRSAAVTNGSKPVVQVEHVKAAIRDSDYLRPSFFIPRRLIEASAVACLPLVALLMWPSTFGAVNWSNPLEFVIDRDGSRASELESAATERIVAAAPDTGSDISESSAAAAVDAATTVQEISGFGEELLGTEPSQHAALRTAQRIGSGDIQRKPATILTVEERTNPMTRGRAAAAESSPSNTENSADAANLGAVLEQMVQATTPEVGNSSQPQDSSSGAAGSSAAAQGSSIQVLKHEIRQGLATAGIENLPVLGADSQPSSAQAQEQAPETIQELSNEEVGATAEAVETRQLAALSSPANAPLLEGNAGTNQPVTEIVESRDENPANLPATVSPHIRGLVQALTLDTPTSFSKYGMDVAPVIENRVIETLNWVQNLDRSDYTVQLLSGNFNDVDHMEYYLPLMTENNMVDDIYVCVSKNSSGNYWTVKFGQYDDRSSASAAIARLPRQLRQHGAYVQSLQKTACSTNAELVAGFLEK